MRNLSPKFCRKMHRKVFRPILSCVRGQIPVRQVHKRVVKIPFAKNGKACTLQVIPTGSDSKPLPLMVLQSWKCHTIYPSDIRERSWYGFVTKMGICDRQETKCHSRLDRRAGSLLPGARRLARTYARSYRPAAKDRAARRETASAGRSAPHTQRRRQPSHRSARVFR